MTIKTKVKAKPKFDPSTIFVSQIALVQHIMHFFTKQKIELNIRQCNAVITAANIIANQVAKPNVPSRPGMGLQAWLDCDDTGLSSRYMAHVLADGPACECHYPLDPEDFGRCYRFLRAVPGKRAFSNLSRSKVWLEFVLAWPELEKLYEEELPTGNAPKLFARMTEIIKNAEKKS